MEQMKTSSNIVYIISQEQIYIIRCTNYCIAIVLLFIVILFTTTHFIKNKLKKLKINLKMNITLMYTHN
jgi:hypothetical protein